MRSSDKKVRVGLKRCSVIIFTIVVGFLSSPSFAFNINAKKGIQSDKVKIKSSQKYRSKNLLLTAYLFKPKGDGPFPTVVLMHGCGGWQAPVRMSLSLYASFLVENGFAVLNLDSFGPRRNSGGQVCASFKKLKDAREYRTTDAFDAMLYLKNQEFVDADNIFLMGQSNGGSVAINVANSGKRNDGFRAVAAYYPWCGAFGNRKVDLSSPLLVLGGAKDDWVPPQGCKKVVSSGKELRVTIYPNAPHSFDINILQQRYLGKLVGYDKHAAQKSRGAMLAFFNDHLTFNAQATMLKLAKN